MTDKSFIKAYGLLCVLALGAYWLSFGAPFQLDDFGTIVDNSVIRNVYNIPFLWHYDPTRFIPHFTFALNYNFHGLDVVGYHVVNFVLHLLNGAFVYLLAKEFLQLSKFKKDQVGLAAFFITGFFLLHPLQTSTVTYVVQRSTLLAALCYFAAMYFYTKYRLDQRSLVWAFVALGVGMFCKPNFITLPFALVLIECVLISGKKQVKPLAWSRLSVFLLPILVIPILLGLWQARAQGLDHIVFLTRETDAISRQEYLFTQIHVVVDYLRLMLFPIGQNLDYDYPIIKTLYSVSTVLRLGILLSLLVSAIVLFKRKPLYAFGILFGFLTLSIESSIFPISDVIFEHRMYVPLFGFLLAIVPWVMELIAGKYRKNILLCVLVLMLIFSGYRNYIWSDQILFLEDNYRKSPNKARVINRLGYAYFQQKKAQPAYEKFTEAITKDPNYPEAYLNRGLLMYEFKNLEAALQDFGMAIEVRPHFYQAYNNRGIVLAALGQTEWAFKDYNKAIELNYYFTEAYINRARLFAQQSRWPEALGDLNRAEHLDPQNAHIFNNRGIIFVNQNRFEQAVSDFKKAIEIDPLNTSALENYKNALKLWQQNP